MYKFFWKGFSPFSNWYISRFKDETGLEFTCVEQYMMYKKAELFQDQDIMSKILHSKDPKEIKALGRLVVNFKPSVWDKEKYRVVKQGCKYKFMQNEGIKKTLLKYTGHTFVEASPYDRIWGIGYTEEGALQNISTWGENLLGKILTELSQEL